MDAFVKVRRNRSKSTEDQKDGGPDRKVTTKTDPPADRKQTSWSVYFPTGPLRAHQLAARKEPDETTSYASSGYIPSFSSGYQDSDDLSSCSSPLTCSGESSQCDDLEDAIERAELCSQSYKETLALADVIRSQCDHKDVPNGAALKQPNPAGRGMSIISTTAHKSPMFRLSSDLFAEVMGFLAPPETLRVLTMPLCKEWRRSYASHQDLWKVLCGFKPFNATNWYDDDDSSSDSSFCSLSHEPMVNNIFGKYRLKYTSFVRCMQYLARIKEDARNGRPPSVIDYGQRGFPSFGASKGLKKFLTSSKGALGRDRAAATANQEQVASVPIGVSDDGYSTDQASRKRPATASGTPMAKKPKFGNSMITARLLGPAADGKPSHLSLPQSCAIYSIVNWMVAFPDVEGIQTMCIDCLPCLLEDEQQRLTAQRVGLVEVVLRAMLRFRDSLELHVAALHTMVLLARPLGGKEGMLFDHSMAESSANLGLAGGTSGPSALARCQARGVAALDRTHGTRLSGINGIDIMIDSMRRFESEAKLQAMGCWAMVNLALVPAQKTMLISLDAIQATIKAMQIHPESFDVQFRALFALINLVVPCGQSKDLIYARAHSEFKTEKEVLDSNMTEIVRLVLCAMKNFCSSETILNRACLVLHNISQNREYLGTLLWTPHCYQMIEWCIVNHPTDQVLRRSAVSVLHRLQVFLSENESLRIRFRESIRSEQQFAVPHAVAQE